jgi:UDP-N-acetylmuramyl pentapeptide phosphotransferase/UDP-N-acetylglucosamine-1-phosphate transferase
MEAVATYFALSFFKPIFKGIGITGNDVHKQHNPEVPEAMGLIAGLVLCMFMTHNPIFYCTLIGLWTHPMVLTRWKLAPPILSASHGKVRTT